MILGKILLALIVFYEMYRILSLKDFIRTIEIMNEIKTVEKGTDEYLKLGFEMIDNKRYIFIIVAEILYLVFIVVLFFTPYLLVSILLIVQSLIIKHIQKNNKNRQVLQADSIISILIILVGLLVI